MKFGIFYLLFALPIISIAQNKYYEFNIYEGKDYLLTMNQSNDLMLNSLRYIGGSINNDNLSKKEKRATQVLCLYLLHY